MPRILRIEKWGEFRVIRFHSTTKGLRGLLASPLVSERCESRDLNPDGFPHWILSPARLPIPPLSRAWDLLSLASDNTSWVSTGLPHATRCAEGSFPQQLSRPIHSFPANLSFDAEDNATLGHVRRSIGHRLRPSLSHLPATS